MDNQKILADYARYYNVLQTLGNFPLSENPTIEDLGVSKAQLQSGYKDIKDSKFDGSFTDYLCLVSLRFMVFTAGSGVTEFLLRNLEKYRSDITNILRLVIRKPDIYFGETGGKPDKKAFTELAGIYFELYHISA